MKNTPFKMKGFSGFGNSPLRDTEPHTGENPPGHTHNTIVSSDLSSGGLMRSRGGGPRSNNNKRRGSNFWSKLGRGTLKTIDKILPGGNDSIWKGNIKIACGSGGCKK